MTRRTPITPLLALLVGVAVAAPAIAASGEGGGVNPFFQPKLLPLTMALFVLVAIPANRLLFQPMLRILDRRRERIEGARAEAQTASREAQEILSSYQASLERARAEADEARRSLLEAARRDQVRITGDARGEAEQEASRVRHEVASALDDARVKLREQTERLGREAAARVLGRELS
jgi:F-type H+-transporting ATPase subunit b